MQHTVFRKRVNFKISLYITILMFSMPLFVYNAFRHADYLGFLQKQVELVSLGEIDSAERNFKLGFRKYGYKKKTLIHYYHFLLEKQKTSPSSKTLVAILQTSDRLKNHFGFSSKNILAETGKIYYHMGASYYAFAEKYLTKVSAGKTIPEIDEILYQIYVNQKRVADAQAIAQKLSKQYPENESYLLKLAKCYIYNGRLMDAQSILEKIVYENDYSKHTEEAGAVLIPLLSERLGLKKKGLFVYEYILNKGKGSLTLLEKNNSLSNAL